MKRRFTVIGSGHPQTTFMYVDDQPFRNVKEAVFKTGADGVTVEVTTYCREGGQFLRDATGELRTETLIYSTSDTDFEMKIDPLFPYLVQVSVPPEDQVQHLLEMLRICSERHMISTEDLATALGWKRNTVDDALKSVELYSTGWEDGKKETSNV